jgi:hypothetical protein
MDNCVLVGLFGWDLNAGGRAVTLVMTSRLDYSTGIYQGRSNHPLQPRRPNALEYTYRMSPRHHVDVTREDGLSHFDLGTNLKAEVTEIIHATQLGGQSSCRNDRYITLGRLFVTISLGWVRRPDRIAQNQHENKK